MTPKTPYQRAARIAAGQHGAIAHRQARAAGLSEDQVRGLLDRGTWIRRVRGVSILAGSPDTPMQRLFVAQLATSGADSTVSHISAAAVDGLLSHPVLPHLSVEPGRSAACRAARIHRSPMPVGHRRRHSGLLVTTTSRTIVDIAALVERQVLEDVVDDAFCRKLATRESVHAVAGELGQGRAGVAVAREAVSAWAPGIEVDSVGELRAIRRLGDLGLTGLVTQYEVRDETGAFVARLDLADPPRRRGFEYDGVLRHSPRYWARDEPRALRLRRLGWEVETLDKLDLLPGSPRLAAIVTRWLAAAS